MKRQEYRYDGDGNYKPMTLQQRLQSNEEKRRMDDRIVEVSAWLMVLLMLSAGVWAIWMIATH